MPKRQYVWNILILIGLALFFGLLARQAKRYFREQFEREAYEIHIRKMREGNSPDVNYPTFEEHRHGLPRFEWTMASDRKKPRELNPQELQGESTVRRAAFLTSPSRIGAALGATISEKFRVFPEKIGESSGNKSDRADSFWLAHVAEF